MPWIEAIKVFCFAASYSVALAFETWHQFRPRPILRMIGLGFGAAGLLAHTLFVFVQPLELATAFGSLIFLGWILAVFYLYGSLHHSKVAWGLFVLPLILGLTVLASLTPNQSGMRESLTLWQSFSWQGARFWGQVHGGLVMLAAVGVCVGFIASIMYLVQTYRLKAKIPPGQGMKLLSLERLETMNRRAIFWAFPFLTVGLIVGVVLLLRPGSQPVIWTDPKILGLIGLWVVSAILLYLRYGIHARGRQVAIWTIVAFGLMVISLAFSNHQFAAGGMQ